MLKFKEYMDDVASYPPTELSDPAVVEKFLSFKHEFLDLLHKHYKLLSKRLIEKAIGESGIKCTS